MSGAGKMRLAVRYLIELFLWPTRAPLLPTAARLSGSILGVLHVLSIICTE